MKHLSLYIESMPGNPGWHAWHRCLSWREVRRTVRIYRGMAGPIKWQVTRHDRRRPDPLSRTMNRIGVQALKRAGI